MNVSLDFQEKKIFVHTSAPSMELLAPSLILLGHLSKVEKWKSLNRKALV